VVIPHDLRWISEQIQTHIAAVIERDIASRAEVILQRQESDITLQIGIFCSRVTDMARQTALNRIVLIIGKERHRNKCIKNTQRTLAHRE
jgi:hypothetical protein